MFSTFQFPVRRLNFTFHHVKIQDCVIGTYEEMLSPIRTQLSLQCPTHASSHKSYCVQGRLLWRNICRCTFWQFWVLKKGINIKTFVADINFVTFYFSVRFESSPSDDISYNISSLAVKFRRIMEKVLPLGHVHWIPSLNAVLILGDNKHVNIKDQWVEGMDGGVYTGNIIHNIRNPKSKFHVVAVYFSEVPFPFFITSSKHTTYPQTLMENIQHRHFGNSSKVNSSSIEIKFCLLLTTAYNREIFDYPYSLLPKYADIRKKSLFS